MGMGIATLARLWISLLKYAALSVLFAGYGAFVLVRGAVRLVRRARCARHAFADELACPNGHPNRAVGRWSCRVCGCEYLGWVGECVTCHAGADWFPCEVCHCGIPLPWERN